MTETALLTFRLQRDEHSSTAGFSSCSNDNIVAEKGVRSMVPLSSNNLHLQKVENINDQKQFLVYVPPTNLRDFVKNFTPTSEMNANKGDNSSVKKPENTRPLEDASLKLNSNLSSLNTNNYINITENVNPELSNFTCLNNNDQTTFLSLPSSSNSPAYLSSNLTPLQLNLEANENNKSNSYPKILFIPTFGGQSLLHLNQTEQQGTSSSSVENICSNVSVIKKNFAPSKNIVIKLVPIINQNIND